MKVLIFLSQLSRGGAARVTCTLCHEMIKRGYDVHVATNTGSIFYELPNEAILHEYHVHKYGSGIWSSLKMNYGYCRVARKIIKQVKPDVIIGVEPRTYLYTKIGSLGLHIPVIASDHTSFSRKQDTITNFIRYKFYGTADAVTILTKKDYNLLGKKYPQKTIIYNPLSFPILDHPTIRKQNILCAGRLDVWHIKGFDIILNCWQELATEYPEWILEIAGDGSDESTNYIQKSINEKGLNNRVILLGQVENMQRKLAETSIFALPSRIEGFPMVLMEAMSQGCACIAYEVGGATSEMITNNVDGIIIPDQDIQSFTNGLKVLMDKKDLREKLSQNALSSILRFAPSHFMNAWDNLINKVVQK